MPNRVEGKEDLFKFTCNCCGGTALITYDDWNFSGEPAGWVEIHESIDSEHKTEPSGKFLCGYCRINGDN